MGKHLVDIDEDAPAERTGEGEAMLAKAAAGFESLAADSTALAAYRAESREIEAAFDAPAPEW